MPDRDGQGEVLVEFQPRPEGGQVARVTIARKAKLNALNTPLMWRFATAMAEVSSHEELRAVVLTGAGGRAFVGGADLREMAAVQDGATAMVFIEHVHACCAAVRDCPVPVIARIDGWTLGAGLELAAACDLRIAAEGARFGMPEVLVGIPSVVEAALLPALIGWGRTRRLLLLGETIAAAEALDWGLLERVVPADHLDAAVAEWLAHLGAAGPLAIRAQKALIRRWESLPLGEAIAAGIPAFSRSWESDEPRRAMAGFLARPRARG